MSFSTELLAQCWLPFVCILLAAVWFSWHYVRHYQSRYDSELSSTIVAILALAVTIISSLLVPVDVFLVSFLKYDNGTFKPWANETTRIDVLDTVEIAYYVLYTLVLMFAFVICPFVYFYYEEKDDVGNAERACTAFKYTAMFVVIVSVLMIAGLVVPFRDPPPQNSTQWERLEILFSNITVNHGEDAIAFVLSVLTLIGMTLFCIYTGIGITSYPMGLLYSSSRASDEYTAIRTNRTAVENRINQIRQKYGSTRREMERDDRSRLTELNEEEHHLGRQERYLRQRSIQENTCWYKMSVCCSPFRVCFGFIVIFMSMLIFASLAITNIDKLLHSLGPKMGYALPERTLPNPIDMVFVYAQMVFPVDYLLFAAIILLFILCSMSAIKHVGIWFLWVKVYKIRAGRTQPQGLLLVCMTLMFILLALNVVLFSLVPQYLLFGNQHYFKTIVEKNVTSYELVQCSLEASIDDCVPTKISMFIARFCYKLWYFGAAYYWQTWSFLVIFIFGGAYNVFFRKQSSSIEGLVEKDDFDESDEDDDVILRR